MNHRANLIKLGDKYAVLKYLLPPKYYHDTKIANEPHRQLKVRGLHYVLFSAHEIIEDIKLFVAPHPMDGYFYPMDGYLFPNYGQLAPYPQQIYTSRFIYSNHKGVHIHNSMRTGKSLSCLWAMDNGLKTGLFKKVLICAPKTLMSSTWAKELSHHFMELPYTILRGVARDRPSKTQIDIINHDGLTILINKGIIANYDLIIYDESTAVKTSSSARFKALEKYKKKTNCALWLLTGTPLAQSPLAAYGNAKLVNPTLVPKSFTAWRQLTCYNPWGFEWLPRTESPNICANVLQPCVRFELNDIIEIADHTYEFVECKKSEKQAKMFKQMAEQFAAEYDSQSESTINAVNAAAKTSKLLQILSGVVYDENKSSISTDATPRLEALCDLIDQLPEDQPIVVFAEWTHLQEMLRDYLKPRYGAVEIMNGSTPTHDKEGGRLYIERQFLAKKIKVLIPHPVVCSMGLNLSSTNVIAWFTPTFRAELFQQGNERVRNYSSASQGYHKFLIYQFISDNLERKYFESLRDKDLTQKEFFKLVRSSIKEEFGI